MEAVDSRFVALTHGQDDVAFPSHRHVPRGFVCSRGRFVEIGDLPGGNSASSAQDINKAGQVAGAVSGEDECAKQKSPTSIYRLVPVKNKRR